MLRIISLSLSYFNMYTVKFSKRYMICGDIALMAYGMCGYVLEFPSLTVNT